MKGLDLATPLLALAFLTAAPGCRPAADPQPAGELPDVMLWAWHGPHGPHDLEFIDPRTSGVAFLAGVVRLEGDSVSLSPETRLLAAPPATRLLPVVRVEIDSRRPVSLDSATRAETRAAVLGFDDPRAPGLQLDFDATLSQRAFYRDLLTEIRAALGERFLSVTALPSWCLDDRWLPTDLIDEVVPMVYRMGPDGERVRRRLGAGGDFAAGCRGAFGLSADEPVAAPAGRGRRLYLFNPERWDAGSLARLLAAARTGAT